MVTYQISAQSREAVSAPPPSPRLPGVAVVKLI